MKYILILILFYIPIDSLANEKLIPERSLWYDIDYLEIFGIDKKGVALYEKKEKGRFSIKTIKKLDNISFSISDNGKITFQESQNFPYSYALLDAKNSSLTLINTDKKVLLQQAPNVQPNDLVGKWYSYSSTESIETSAIITYRMNSYDYDFVSLNHGDKTYSTSTDEDKNLPYSISNGWLFKEANDEIGFVITSFSKNAMTIVFLSGEKQIDKKYNGQKHLVIPKDYTKE